VAPQLVTPRLPVSTTIPSEMAVTTVITTSNGERMLYNYTFSHMPITAHLTYLHARAPPGFA
jgi:hypothetical protein